MPDTLIERLLAMVEAVMEEHERLAIERRRLADALQDDDVAPASWTRK